jgi:cullin 1
VPNNEHILNLERQGFSTYRGIIFDPLREHVRNCILNAIDKEREGSAQDRELLSNAVKVFVDLGFILGLSISVYETEFQLALVERSKHYYKIASRQWLDQDNCPDYMIKAENALQQEIGRLSSYLHHTSNAPLLAACREELLRVHEKELLEKKSGINDLLERGATEDLSRMYRLYAELPDGKLPIAEAYKEHVKKLGYGLIEQSKSKAAGPPRKGSGPKEEVDEHELIRLLIELHERYHDIVWTCFAKDQVFEKALKEAFEDFINAEFYVSNLLAKFVHAVLLKGSKVQVTDVEKVLDHG